jgi:hypothetical protein
MIVDIHRLADLAPRRGRSQGGRSGEQRHLPQPVSPPFGVDQPGHLRSVIAGVGLSTTAARDTPQQHFPSDDGCVVSNARRNVRIA